MKTEEIFARLLNVQTPWRVSEIRADMGKAQMDIWITDQPEKRGWFGFKQPPTSSQGVLAWRHINLCEYRCVIHAPAVNADNAPSWSGTAELPFTRGLVAWIDSMVQGGINPQHIAQTMDIPAAQLWRIESVRQHGKAASSQEEAVGAKATVPPQDSPVWEQLLDGSASIDIHFLGLKMLLSNMQKQYAAMEYPAFRQMKAHELYRYFKMYAPMLEKELVQVKAMR